MTTTSTSASTSSTASVVGLVARREITTKLRDKAFLASVAITVTVLVGTLVVNAVIAVHASAVPTVAAVGTRATEFARRAGARTHQVPNLAAGRALLADSAGDRVNAVVSVRADDHVTLTATSEVSDGLQRAFSQQPTVHLLEPPPANRSAMLAVGIGVAVLSSSSRSPSA